MKMMHKSSQQQRRSSCYNKPAFALIALIALIFAYYALRNRSPEKQEDIRSILCPDAIQPMKLSSLDSSETSLYFGRNYPSLGGPGCPCPCKDSSLLTCGTIWNTATTTWPNDLMDNFKAASIAFKAFGPVLSMDFEREVGIHMAFMYHCCVSEKDMLVIGEIIKSFAWRDISASFDRVTCVKSSHNKVSIVLVADQQTEQSLQEYAREFERALHARGVSIQIKRDQLQEFHITLGLVNETVYDCRKALERVNKRIPPGTWSSQPVILHRPICRKCDKLLRKTTL